ncbi:hypothetical protein GCM10009861_19060 [Neomicrococcus aestuarii]
MGAEKILGEIRERSDRVQNFRSELARNTRKGVQWLVRLEAARKLRRTAAKNEKKGTTAGGPGGL